MTRPQKDAIAHLDWVVTCSKSFGGHRCNADAAYFVEVHKPGSCRHPSLNSAGNLEAFVCGVHLQLLEEDAERVVRKYRPLPFWLRWFREDTDQRCPSCHALIVHAGDVLQCVIQLPEGTV